MGEILATWLVETFAISAVAAVANVAIGVGSNMMSFHKIMND